MTQDDLMADITLLLKQSRSVPSAREELIRLVYDHLHTVALARLAEWPAARLQPTELLHEAYLRLFPGNGKIVDCKDRAEFFGYASRAMRQVLIGLYRKGRAQKRGEGVAPLPLLDADAAESWLAHEEVDVLDLFDVLAIDHPLSAKIAELRTFCGLTFDEIAELLQASDPSVPVTVALVKKHWSLALAWLRHRLGGDTNGR